MFDYGTDTVLPPSGHAAATAAAGDAAAQARAEILAEAASISNVIGAMDDSVDKAGLLANLRVVVGSALNSLQNASPASVSGILAQLKNLSKEMQQDAQEEVLSKDHKISVNATTSKINNDQAQQIAKRLDAIAHRQAEEARAAREASERDNLVSARKGTVPRASDEEIAEARSRFQEASESSDSVARLRAAQNYSDALGGTERVRINRRRNLQDLATGNRLVDQTIDAASRGDIVEVLQNVSTAADAGRRKLLSDPRYQASARDHFSRYMANQQNATKMHSMGVANFEQFENYREARGTSYQQASARISDRDGIFDSDLTSFNALSYEESVLLFDMMYRTRNVTNNALQKYKGNGIVRATDDTIVMNDIIQALNRNQISTAQADTNNDNQLSINEIDAAFNRIRNNRPAAANNERTTNTPAPAARTRPSAPAIRLPDADDARDALDSAAAAGTALYRQGVANASNAYNNITSGVANFFGGQRAPNRN